MRGEHAISAISTISEWVGRRSPASDAFDFCSSRQTCAEGRGRFRSTHHGAEPGNTHTSEPEAEH